jgi:16S rRNA processing protein RimM
MSSATLIIATIAKPHGIRGAVRIHTRSEHVAFLRTLPEVRVGTMATRVRAVAGTDDRPIVSFEGIDDRNAAEQIRGLDLAVERELLPPPVQEDDEYFRADLEGCLVVAEEDGRELGCIIRVDILPANDVLVVRTSRGPRHDILVPFIKDAVPVVDVAARRVTVRADFLGIDEVDA